MKKSFRWDWAHFCSSIRLGAALIWINMVCNDNYVTGVSSFTIAHSPFCKERGWAASEGEMRVTKGWGVINVVSYVIWGTVSCRESIWSEPEVLQPPWLIFLFEKRRGWRKRDKLAWKSTSHYAWAKRTVVSSESSISTTISQSMDVLEVWCYGGATMKSRPDNISGPTRYNLEKK